MAHREIQDHQKKGYIITVIQTLCLLLLLAYITQQPFALLLSKNSLRTVVPSSQSLGLVISGMSFLSLRLYMRSKKIFLPYSFTGFIISSFLFTQNFILATPFFTHFAKGSLFSRTRVLFTAEIGFNFLFSTVSALLLTYMNYSTTPAPVFSRTRGLITFLIKSSPFIIQNTMFLYLQVLLISCSFLLVYLGTYQYFFRYIFAILRVGFTKGSYFGLLKHFITLNITMITYFYVVNLIDCLVIFNSSLLSLKFSEFMANASGDINDLRFLFFQFSGLAMKYKQIRRNAAVSPQLIASINEYIRMEIQTLLRLLNKVLDEREHVNAKVWLTIPQVGKNLPSDRFKNKFAKKIRSYNFIEVYAAKAVYAWKLYSFRSEYRRLFVYLDDASQFVIYLRDYKENFMLLKDNDESTQLEFNKLINKTKEVEKSCRINLCSGYLIILKDKLFS